MRKRYVVIALCVALAALFWVTALGLVGSTTSEASLDEGTGLGDGPDYPQLTGTDETLVIVVTAESFDSETAAREAIDELNRSFGNLQGLYIDQANNYGVHGLYVNVNPQTLLIPCNAAAALAQIVPDQDESECPASGYINELQQIQLELVPKDDMVRDRLDDPVHQACMPLDGWGVPFVTTQACESAYALLVSWLRSWWSETDNGLHPPEGKWLGITAFRTRAGAEEFLDLARAVGVSELIALNATKTGGSYIGLGQEPNPDGSGPLLAPLPNQANYQ